MNQVVRVKNRLRIPFKINLKNTTFALQYKAKDIKKELLKYKAKNQLACAQKLVDQLFEYLLKRRKIELTDKDPHFFNNFGILNDKVVSIDIGGLIRDPKKETHYFFTKELKKAEKRALPWLHKHYPELEKHAKKRFAELSEKYLENRDLLLGEKDLLFNLNNLKIP